MMHHVHLMEQSDDGLNVFFTSFSYHFYLSSRKTIAKVNQFFPKYRLFCLNIRIVYEITR